LLSVLESHAIFIVPLPAELVIAELGLQIIPALWQATILRQSNMKKRQNTHFNVMRMVSFQANTRKMGKAEVVDPALFFEN